MTAGAEIRGMADRFRDAPAQAVDLIRVATEKTVIDTQATARRRAPVDTGYLRASIFTRTGINGTTVWGEVGAGANYAAYVENGTTRQSPQPFMRPALEAHQKPWAQAMTAIGLEAIT